MKPSVPSGSEGSFQFSKAALIHGYYLFLIFFDLALLFFLPLKSEPLYLSLISFLHRKLSVCLNLRTRNHMVS